MELKKKYFRDILQSISLIDTFLADITSFSQYKTDVKTKSAVERQLTIIGEATKRLKEIDDAELVNYHSKIIGFRNIIVHAYDSIDDEIVWAIIVRHLKPLKEEVLERLR